MGAITGFAGAFAGGAAATTGAASTTTRVATGVAKGANAAQGAVVAVKTKNLAGLVGAAAEGLGAASSFAPNHAGLTRAASSTTRAAQGAVVAQAAAKRDLSTVAGAALSLGTAGVDANRAKLLERIAGATHAAVAGARGDWAGALEAGTALAADLTRNGKLEEASRLLSGVRAAQVAQKSGDWALAAQEVASLGQAARQLFTKPEPQLLQSRSLAGVGQLAPVVTGTNVTVQEPALLESRSLIGIAALAPAVRGTTSTPQPAPKPQPSRQVKELQTALRSAGADVTADGLMGPKTEAALKHFQKQNGLKVTGVGDAATIRALSTPRDVAPIPNPAAERFKLGLAKAEVGLRLDQEQNMAQELIRTGNRGAIVGHAAGEYLKMIAHSRKELANATNEWEIEAALRPMRQPAENLQAFVHNDKILNHSIKEVGKWWLSTAAQTTVWFCPPVGAAVKGGQLAANFLSKEGSLREKLVASGTDALKDYLMGELTGRFGGAVAKQLEGHLNAQTLEHMKAGLEKGLEVKDMLQEFMDLGPN
ncbi:MAG: peptidoglycan-binding protein [Myxococcaceae bacterium]|nr:peptidoglycan-binding protein [Myxococcaceae bacterium]